MQNALTSIKQVMKHNKFFRTCFYLPLMVRGRWISRNATRLAAVWADVVVGGELLLKPRNLGYKFYVPANSDLAKRVIVTGVYEPELCELIKSVWQGPGCVLNIGANVGFWALGILNLIKDVERVFAIEPNPEAYRMLDRNITANGLAKVVIPIQACISESSGRVEFEVIEGMPEYSSIGGISHSAVAGRSRTTILVDTKPLEEITELAGATVKLVLIDTEGAEYLVFKGAREWLKINRPVIIFECDSVLLAKFGHSVAMVKSLLDEIGYAVVNAEMPSMKIPDTFRGEVLAIPK